jgi:hypothetical protein
MKEVKVNYIEKAQKLSQEQRERVLSRMVGKLPKRLLKEKLTPEEAIAIQLELEDEQLQEWRKNMVEIEEKALKAKAKAEEKAAAKAEKSKKEVAAKAAPNVKPAKPSAKKAEKPADKPTQE